MRIFLSYCPSGNISVPDSNTWFKNLHAPLIDLGHDVFVLQLDEVAIKYNVSFRGSKFKEIFSYELKKVFFIEHNKKPFDLFFSYLTKQDVYSEVISIIGKTGVPTLNFSCNNTHQFHLVEEISKSFDFNLHSEKDAAGKFISIGAKPLWFPMSANPKYYFPTKVALEYDVSFIGAAYAKRAFYINHLVQNGVDTTCFGPNWLINKPHSKLKRVKKESDRLKWIIQSFFNISPEKRLAITTKMYYYDLLVNVRKINLENLHYPCSEGEMNEIFNQSKINLGFLEVFSEDNKKVVQQHIHLREFEVPMSGGLYMTNYSEELAEFYKIDKEVVVYRNEHELLDKVRFYLKNDLAAQKIRLATYSRAINCHTCHIRFQNLFNELNLT